MNNTYVQECYHPQKEEELAERERQDDYRFTVTERIEAAAAAQRGSRVLLYMPTVTERIEAAAAAQRGSRYRVSMPSGERMLRPPDAQAQPYIAYGVKYYSAERPWGLQQRRDSKGEP